MKKRYIVMGIMSLVIFIMFYTYSLKILNALDAISTTNIKGSDLDENNVIEPIHDHELLFLLAGVDQNDGKNGEYTRTDTLMLIKANVDTGSFDIISIPRDCRIKVNGKLDKVNHAHSYGGIKLTLKSLRDFLGVDIDYYVKIDFDAVVKVVDAIGGVEVDVPVTINEPLLNIYIKKGRRKLNGKEALMFVRFRRGYAKGDLGRVKQQQKFMTELIKQTLNSSNILKIPDMLESFKGDIETNIPLHTLISLSKRMANMDKNKIKTHTIPGEYGYKDSLSYFFPNKKKVNELVDNILHDYKLK